MRKRLVTVGTRATVAAIISLASVFLTAQAPTTPSGKTANAYKTPRTPWGDPDLQGTYTNKYEQGTPFERPNEFEGRRVEDVTGEELAAVLPGSMLPAIYGDSYQIIQSPGHVAIRYEMIHETRVIPLDTRSHVGKSVGLDMGDARGRWEGDTLVIETTNFRGRSIYRQGNPERFRLIERFTRVSRDKVEWAVTVDDPTTWTRPWTFAVPLTLNDSEPVLEYACHEGNYAVSNILSGARAAEAGR